MYPGDYRYTKQHEWIKGEGNIATVGITDYAQHALGDIVYVELPKLGAKFDASQSFGTVESVKAVSEIYCPVSGEVVAINSTLVNEPEKINQDPHGAAWLIKIRLDNPTDLNALMDAASYAAYIADKQKEASA